MGVSQRGCKANSPPAPGMRTLQGGPCHGDPALGTLGWCPRDGHEAVCTAAKPHTLAWLCVPVPAAPAPRVRAVPGTDKRRGQAGMGQRAPGVGPDNPPGAWGAAGWGSGAAPGVPVPTHLVGQGLVLWVGSAEERRVSGMGAAGTQRSWAGPCPPPDPRSGGLPCPPGTCHGIPSCHRVPSCHHVPSLPPHPWCDTPSPPSLPPCPIPDIP